MAIQTMTLLGPTCLAIILFSTTLANPFGFLIASTALAINMLANPTTNTRFSSLSTENCEFALGAAAGGTGAGSDGGATGSVETGGGASDSVDAGCGAGTAGGSGAAGVCGSGG